MLKSLIMFSILFGCNVCDYKDNYEHHVYAHKQAMATFDTSAIYEGVFKPENIVIHVAQNLINFLATTLAWSFIMHVYQAGLIRV